ncbi:MAG TPA: glycogen synthase GlgA [bacterium]|nr:glycogen synthase GlgA [bacterium]
MTEEGKLKILMASSEAVPYAKTGGLADVAGALPRALRARGHDVRLVLPYYGCIRKANLPACDTGISVPVTISGRTETARIWESAMDDGTPVSLIRKDGYYDRDELYGTAEGYYHDNAERFCFFSRAVVALAKRMGIAPDIVHCHDWQTGLVCALLKVVERAHPVFAGTGAVFTIHNLAYQGLFWHYDMHLTGLPWNVFTAEGIEFYGKINLLKAGIVYADAITTVSRRYSEEIQGAELGCGLEGLLARRRGDLHGILNGADYRQWDPASDPHLAARYTPDALEGKARCKEDLLRLFGLNLPPGTPLAGMVGRMADQKGYDLLAAALPGLLDAGLALVILGKGEERYHRLLRHLAKGSSGRLGVKIAFDNALAHKIEAGADYYLMPSRYEPCGLNQIYSLRYGTVPIVRAVGGLDDTVSAYAPATGEGNGFKFVPYTAGAFLGAVREALKIFEREPHWTRIRRNAMACDFSWDRSAREYERVYREAILRARGGGRGRGGDRA